MSSAPARVAHLVDLFNAGVRSGRFDEYLDALADTVRVEFVNGGPAPLEGRAAVARAYAEQPPDDTLSVLNLAAEGYVDIVEFAWDRGGDGTMRVAWTPDGRVATLTVEFA